MVEIHVDRLPGAARCAPEVHHGEYGVVVTGERERGELRHLHRRPEGLEERGDAVLAVVSPVPWRHRGTGVRRPVHVVGHGAEDPSHIAACEGPIHRLNALDVLLRSHEVAFLPGSSPARPCMSHVAHFERLRPYLMRPPTARAVGAAQGLAYSVN